MARVELRSGNKKEIFVDVPTRDLYAFLVSGDDESCALLVFVNETLLVLQPQTDREKRALRKVSQVRSRTQVAKVSRLESKELQAQKRVGKNSSFLEEASS